MALVLGMAMGWSAGCGKMSKKNQIHVSGTIEYQGRPVPAGIIYFTPDVGKSGDGPQGFTKIKDGRYDTRLNPNKDGRPGTGPYLMVIFAADGVIGPEAPIGQPLMDGSYEHAVDFPEVDTEKNIIIPDATKR